MWYDTGVANYRWMGKKWWWPLFVNTPNGALKNWKLNNRVIDDKILQLDLKSFVAIQLIKTSTKVAQPLGLECPNGIMYLNGLILTPKVQNEESVAYAIAKPFICVNSAMFFYKLLFWLVIGECGLIFFETLYICVYLLLCMQYLAVYLLCVTKFFDLFLFCQCPRGNGLGGEVITIPLIQIVVNWI